MPNSLDEEKKSRNIFDVFNGLSKTKKLEPGDMELYAPFMINRVFAKFVDCVFLANELNALFELPNEMQKDLYLYATIPKTRFAKWFKPPPNSDELKFIQTSLEVSKTKAISYLELLNDQDKESLKLSKGGMSGKKETIKSSSKKKKI